MIWLQVALFVISLYMSTRAVKTASEKPPMIGDFQFPQFEEGTDQAMIFGDVWMTDWMVLGFADYRSTPIKATGGK